MVKRKLDFGNQTLLIIAEQLFACFYWYFNYFLLVMSSKSLWLEGIIGNTIMFDFYKPNSDRSVNNFELKWRCLFFFIYFVCCIVLVSMICTSSSPLSLLLTIFVPSCVLCRCTRTRTRCGLLYVYILKGWSRNYL